MHTSSGNKPSGTKINIIRKALKISIQARKKSSLLVGAAGFFAAFLPALISMVLRDFINRIQELSVEGAAGLMPAIKLFTLLAALYLIQTVFKSLQSYFSQMDAVDIQAYLKERIMRIACGVSYRYIENYDDFIKKIGFADSFAGFRVAESMGSILLWIQNVITFLTLLAVLVKLDARIVVALLLASIPSTILSFLQKDEDYRSRLKWMKEGALVIHQFHDCCAQYSLNEVRFLGIFNFLKKKWRKNADYYIELKNNLTRKHVLYNSLADLLRNGVFIIILLITARKIYENPAVGIGTFTLVLTAAEQFQAVTAKLFLRASQFLSDISYMQDFFSLDEMQYESLEDEEEPEDGEIRFDHVTFTYPGSSEPAIKDLSVVISPGEKVAIIGENGSGKTSFVNLLCGMYEPDEGTVQVGKKTVTDHLHMVRGQLSAVFQDFGKYEASIRENIIISDTKKEYQEEAMDQLLKKVNLEEFVREQPGGLDEIIGTFNESGNNLSGGQWQRLAIARAAYRDRSSVLILDEPTAALDPLIEAELYRNFANLTGNKTTVLISHRLGIAPIVDRVIVMDHGRIVEDGSHGELLKRKGLYARMFEAQAQWYA